MSLFWLLFLISLEGAWSNPKSFFDYCRITLGGSMTLVNNYANMSYLNYYKNKYHFDDVKEITIKRVHDKDQLGMAPLYEFGIYPDRKPPTVENYAGREAELFGNFKGLNTVPSYLRYYRKDRLGIELLYKNLTCNDIGMVRLIWHGERLHRPLYSNGRLIRDLYLDTEDTTPRIRISPNIGPFEPGTKVFLICSVVSTIEHVKMELYIWIPTDRRVLKLPVDASLLQAGQGKWPEFKCKASYTAYGFPPSRYRSQHENSDTLSLRKCLSRPCGQTSEISAQTAAIVDASNYDGNEAGKDTQAKHYDPNYLFVVPAFVLMVLSILVLVVGTVIIEKRESEYRAQRRLNRRKMRRNKAKRTRHR